jgi:hypothetical protein
MLGLPRGLQVKAMTARRNKPLISSVPLSRDSRRSHKSSCAMGNGIGNGVRLTYRCVDAWKVNLTPFSSLHTSVLNIEEGMT